MFVMQTINEVIKGIEADAHQTSAEDIIGVERFIERTDEALVMLCQMMAAPMPKQKGK